MAGMGRDEPEAITTPIFTPPIFFSNLYAGGFSLAGLAAAGARSPSPIL
jgi:hypothetical protein